MSEANSRATPLTAKEETPPVISPLQLGYPPHSPDGSETRREIIGAALWDAREHHPHFNVGDLGDYIEAKVKVWESAHASQPSSSSEIPLDARVIGWLNDLELCKAPSAVRDARSALESLYREQLQEIERLKAQSRADVSVMGQISDARDSIAAELSSLKKEQEAVVQVSVENLQLALDTRAERNRLVTLLPSAPQAERLIEILDEARERWGSLDPDTANLYEKLRALSTKGTA